MNRRHFIRYASAGATLAAISPELVNAASHQSQITSLSAPRSYRVALIGCGWYGKSDLFRLNQVAPIDVVGLCDVDQYQLAEAQDLIRKRVTLSKPKLYADYRKLLAAVKPEIVLIGTPDHWHALTCIDALRAGAHVYVQKPISVDVVEGEAMVAAARKYNRVVQVGLQRRSTPHLLDAQRVIIQSGKLGKVRHVEMCCYYHMRGSEQPGPAKPVPANLDFDLWTGPAPLRNYEGPPHLGWWRSYMEYGNGIMGDMCVHMFDAVRWLLDLGWPTEVSSYGGIYVDKPSRANIADTQTAVFSYPELNCVWQHRSWGTAVNPDYPWAFTLYGDKGTLWASTMKYDFFPEGNGDMIHADVLYEREKFPEDLNERMIELHCAPATRKHMLDFIDAINTGRKPIADIQEGHISTASCILANLSMQLGRPLRYDPVTRTIPGDPEATALLGRSYRTGWQHPDPSNI